MTAPDSGRLRDVEVLTGRLDEWRELLNATRERPGLLVLACAPWSGTSALLGMLVERLEAPPLLIDARVCSDAGGLADVIADAAVAAYAPEALAWWRGEAPPSSTEGLTLWRRIRAAGLDGEALRTGAGEGEARLATAMELVEVLGRDNAALIVDHLGRMLAAMRADPARAVLATIRAVRQRHGDLDVWLVDHAAGPIERALADERHPLYRAGAVLQIDRPTPDRFATELMVTWPHDTKPTALVRAAADLCAGVPELTWRVVELAPGRSGPPGTDALTGWQELRRLTGGLVARQWDLVRRLHPSALDVVAELSHGRAPHAAPGASKSINDALRRLRDAGQAWQYAPQRWALADPLLAAWARENVPRPRRAGR